MPRPPDPERRTAIVRAARAHFAAHRYAHTSMAEIALTANMGVGSLYVYFPTKEALALTIVDAYFAELYDAIVPPLRDLHGAAAVTQAIADSLRCATHNQDVIELCRLVQPHHRIPECERLQAAIDAAVTAQIEHGYFYPADPQFVSQWVNSQIQWVITACFFEKRGVLAQMQEQVTNVIVRALCTGVDEASST